MTPESKPSLWQLSRDYTDFGVRLRLLVMVLMAFLLTINFITFYVVFQTKKQLESRQNDNLVAVATAIREYSLRVPLLRGTASPSPDQLDPFVTFITENGYLSLVDHIQIMDLNQTVVFSTRQNSGDSIAVWAGLTAEQRFYVGEGLAVFSKSYPVQGLWYRAYYTPLMNVQSNRIERVIQTEIEISDVRHLDLLTRITLIIWVVGIIVGLGLSFLFIRQAVRPIRQLSEEAHQYRTGRGERHVDTNETDLRVVLETFREMVADLQEKEQRLRELYAQAEQRAERIENYNDYILRSIGSGVISFDTTGNVTVFNRTAGAILGRTEAAARGQHFTTLFRQNPALQALIENILTENQPLAHQEVLLEFEDKPAIWVDVSLSALYNDHGTLLGATLLINDLTEIKHLQEQINLKERLSALGEMSAGIAHELRNSLGAIIGYAKLLQKKLAEDDPRRALLDAVFKEAATQEIIVRDFLAFARPSQLTLTAVNLETLLDQVCKGIESREPVVIQREIPADLPHLAGDENLLRQVFLNLIHNAIEARTGDPAHIRIQATSLPQQQLIELHIHDAGHGIPAEILPKIFNPFFTTKASGVGLGLALVHKIVLEHNGTLRVESTEGEGTTFILHLPTSG
ncbi:MAG: PAS domain-containing protein [Gemmatimonadetes bacterium]|nr:MAG: PAS domain-containing protein [Gemmatimonadota bacterium]